MTTKCHFSRRWVHDSPPVDPSSHETRLVAANEEPELHVYISGTGGTKPVQRQVHLSHESLFVHIMSRKSAQMIFMSNHWFVLLLKMNKLPFTNTINMV